MNTPGTTWTNPSIMSAPYGGGVQPGNMWQQPPPSMNNPFTASNGSSVCFN